MWNWKHFFASLLNAACRQMLEVWLTKIKIWHSNTWHLSTGKVPKLRMYSEYAGCLNSKYCQFSLQDGWYFNEVFWQLLPKHQTLNHLHSAEAAQQMHPRWCYQADDICFLYCIPAFLRGRCYEEILSLVQKGKSLPLTEVIHDTWGECL